MILEALPRLLPVMDADVVARLQTESERIGIGFKTAVAVKRIERADGRLRVIFAHDRDEHAAEADRVVNGAGSSQYRRARPRHRQGRATTNKN